MNTGSPPPTQPQPNGDPSQNPAEHRTDPHFPFIVAILTIVGSFWLLSLLTIYDGVSGLLAAGGIVGTWVGVIVTYYFTREQVKSAETTGRVEGTSTYYDLLPQYLDLKNKYDQAMKEVDRLGHALLETLPTEDPKSK